VPRREIADWVEPVPSADQLRYGPPGARTRSEPAPRANREQVARRPRGSSEGPTLFESGS